jgi:membrane protease YdiL (CAAX protease family)
MGSAIARLVRRHPLVTFFVLAYVLSWWGWLLYAADRSPVPIASFGPFLAALVVLSVTHGRAGIGTLLRRMRRWRVGPGWYAVALLLPPAIAGTATGLNFLLGAQPQSGGALADWPGLVLTFLLVLLIPGYGGAWEEPGWRGYALPTLQSRRSALATSLVLGLLVAGWHLPLFATGQASWAELGSIVGATIVFTWVFNGSGGSVLLTMLMHASNNAFAGSLFGRMFSGADAVSQGWLLSGLWCLVAVVVVAVAGSARLSRRASLPTLVEPVRSDARPTLAGPAPRPVGAPVRTA